MFGHFFRPFFNKQPNQPIDIFLEFFKSVTAVGVVSQREIEVIYTAVVKTRHTYPTFHLEIKGGYGISHSYMNDANNVVSIGYDGYDSLDDIAYMTFHELRHIQQHCSGDLAWTYNQFNQPMTVWKGGEPFFDYKPASNCLHASLPHEIDANNYALSFFENGAKFNNESLKEIIHFHNIHMKKAAA